MILNYCKLMFLSAPPEERSEPRTERYEPAPRTHYFSLIGGVCLDYCVVINRPDILFGEVFDRFTAAGKVLAPWFERVMVLIEAHDEYVRATSSWSCWNPTFSTIS
jgi:hypothetical protein